MFSDAFTPRCQKAIKTYYVGHAKCISISSTGLCILYHLVDFASFGGILNEE